MFEVRKVKCWICQYVGPCVCAAQYNPPLWSHQWRSASEQVSVFSRLKQLVCQVFLQFLTIFGVRVFAIIRLYGPTDGAQYLSRYLCLSNILPASISKYFQHLSRYLDLVFK